MHLAARQQIYSLGFLAALVLASVPVVSAAAPSPTGQPSSAVPRARCGPGSAPETGLQGQVPRTDRDSGRSRKGYSCNLKLVGQYQGDGATWVQPSYGHCSYLGTFVPGNLLTKNPGVRVIDVSDERKPRLSTSLKSTAALLGTWETLKVDPVHGYLAAAGTPVPPGVGGMSFDLYDVKTDCAHPRLLNGLIGKLTIPMPVFSHEAQWSPDGNTYYVMSGAPGGVQAIDVSKPARPRLIYLGAAGLSNHGVSFSPDGRTMYGVTIVPAGVQILDVSDIQDRKPSPQIRQIGSVTWSDGLLSQHTINFTRGGHQYLYAIDEAGGGGVRLIDIADPRKPRVLRQYRLEINQAANRAAASADTGGDGVFGYDAHYCSIDRPVDPTRLACGYFQSGIRLFDIRDPLSPRELAYFNPPAQVGRQAGTPKALLNSAHAWAVYVPNVLDPNTAGIDTITGSLKPSMNTDWCSSPPTFKPDNTLWVTCQDNGFMVLKYTPFQGGSSTQPDSGPSPSVAPSSGGGSGASGGGGHHHADAQASGNQNGTQAADHTGNHTGSHDSSPGHDGVLPDLGAGRYALLLAAAGLLLLAVGIAMVAARVRRP